MYVYMYVCIFIKLHITAHSGPVIRVILRHSHLGLATNALNVRNNNNNNNNNIDPPKGGCMYVCMYVCMVTHIARVWINRVRLPVLHVVS